MPAIIPLDQIHLGAHCLGAMRTTATTYLPMYYVGGVVIAAYNRWHAMKRSTGTQEEII